MKKKRLGLGLLLAAALALSGLPVEGSGVFPRHETLIFDMITGPVGIPGNFNNWAGWRNRDQGLQNLIFEALWTMDYTLGVIHNSAAAAPPEYNADFTQMTIRLREGVYWSDGVEFTADDVVFTIETIKAFPGVPYHHDMQAVERVYAVDRYTVLIELYEPNVMFHYHFTDFWGALYPMPKHIFKPVVAQGLEAFLAFDFNPPVGKGAYELHSYDPAGYWTAWVRRDDWERTPTGMMFGKPAPRYVIAQDFPDEAAMIMAMARHELDSAFITIEPVRAVLAVSPYAKTFRPEWPWIEGGHPTLAGIVFNNMRPPFDNPDVRWALTLAMDIVEVSAVAFDGITELSAVHLAAPTLIEQHFHIPMVEWLKDFTLYIGDGEYFHPFDPYAPFRLAEYVRLRGFPAPVDPAAIKEFFGHGWWKYAPDVAERLLKRHGFTRCPEEYWLLPDGTPWKIEILTTVHPASDQFRYAHGVMHAWRGFGIDATVLPTPILGDLARLGEFYVHANRAAASPCGGHINVWQSFRLWDSALVSPLGEICFTHFGVRWSDPRMDEIIAELKLTCLHDIERLTELGKAGLKILVEQMPTIPIGNIPDSMVVCTYWWTGWPCIENPFNVPHHHWSTFKYLLPFLQPTGRR